MGIHVALEAVVFGSVSKRYLGSRFTKWVRINLVDRIDLGYLLVVGKVRSPGRLLTVFQ